jgi:hypothetical protein
MWLTAPCMSYFSHLITTGELTFMRGGRCRASLERLRDSSLFLEADIVVLSGLWAYRGDSSRHLSAMAFAETIAAQGRKVIMVGLLVVKEAPSVHFQAMRKELTIEQIGKYAYETVRRGRIEKPNADIRALAERNPNIRYIDKYALFCSDEDRSCTFFDEDGQLLFADNAHLSVNGSIFLGERIASLRLFQW